MYKRILILDETTPNKKGSKSKRPQKIYVTRNYLDGLPHWHNLFESDINIFSVLFTIWEQSVR